MKIRQLAIEQGHYVTSITDAGGKVSEEVLRVVDQHRPQNSFNRAVRQIEQERMQLETRTSMPPTKSPRLQEATNQPEVMEENLFDDVEEVEDDVSGDEVDSEVSATFNCLNTGVKNEPAPEQEITASSHTVSGPILAQAAAERDTHGRQWNDESQRVELQSPSKREPEISQGEEEMDLTESNKIRGVSKSGKRVKQTQFYGFQVDSNMSGIFFSDHDTTDLDRKTRSTNQMQR